MSRVEYGNGNKPKTESRKWRVEGYGGLGRAGCAPGCGGCQQVVVTRVNRLGMCCIDPFSWPGLPRRPARSDADDRFGIPNSLHHRTRGRRRVRRLSHGAAARRGAHPGRGRSERPAGRCAVGGGCGARRLTRALCRALRGQDVRGRADGVLPHVPDPPDRVERRGGSPGDPARPRQGRLQCEAGRAHVRARDRH